jgi:hypothetical protein
MAVVSEWNLAWPLCQVSLDGVDGEMTSLDDCISPDILSNLFVSTDGFP